jgi:hypothetical protein
MQKICPGIAVCCILLAEHVRVRINGEIEISRYNTNVDI